MAGSNDKNSIIIRALHERAKKLAEPRESDSSVRGTETLIFSIGNETYGIESEHVREVVKKKDITPLPHIPDFVLGIVNHHGVILSVIDIYRFFGIGGVPWKECQYIVFVHTGKLEFGIAVSRVAETIMIRTDNVGVLPDTLKDIAGFIKYITADQTAVLDIERLCADKRILVNQEI